MTTFSIRNVARSRFRGSQFHATVRSAGIVIAAAVAAAVAVVVVVAILQLVTAPIIKVTKLQCSVPRVPYKLLFSRT